MRPKSWIVAVVMLVGIAGGVAVAVTRSTRAPAPREIVLVARGMAFYVEGVSVANPPIVLNAGETVRLTLKNEAPGLQHDLAVPAFMAAIDPIAAGQVRTLTFTAPATPTTTDYLCRPHATMMRGRLQVLAAR
jgi:plastocyanin